MADQTPDATLRTIFEQTRCIAVVGFSANPARPSHYVAQYLRDLGYRIVPVNPGLAGQTFWGEAVVADLTLAPKDIDMIDIFRKPDAVGDIVDEALDHLPNLQTVWMQLGITHADAATKARAKRIKVVEDRCPKIEYPRLFGSRPLTS